MPQDENLERRPADEKLEEHGIVNDVIVPVVASGTGGAAAGAANAVVANLLNRPKKDGKK